jgi:hypothetical protein
VGESVGESLGESVAESVAVDVWLEVPSDVTLGAALAVGLELAVDVALGVSSALADRPRLADSRSPVAAATAAHRRLFRRRRTVWTASLTEPPVPLARQPTFGPVRAQRK